MSEKHSLLQRHPVRVSAYMLNLKPVLRVEGVIKLTGEAINLGGDQSLALRFNQPDGAINSVNKNLTAGAYYAVGLDLQGVNEHVLGKRNYQLTTNVLSQSAGTLGNDNLIGEHLFILITTYFLANDKVQKAGAKLFNTATARTISEGITSFTVSVTSVFGMPKSALPSGSNMDVAMAGVIVSARDGKTSKELAYMDLHGLVGSYHEHDIFEKIDGFSSVSAVRALQIANANGIPIQHINSTNISQTLSTLQVSSAIKTDIQNAVSAGKEVTISQTNITLNDWNGAGYIIKDPVTGAGAYMISGGLAGSDSTSQQDGMQCVQIFDEPFGWLKDNMDPQTRSIIATAAVLEAILQDRIKQEAVDLVSQYTGTNAYYDVGTCVGVVRKAYWAAGICLDEWSECPQKNNPNNLVKKNGIATTYMVGNERKYYNGVRILYDLANKLNINNSVRMTRDPLIGDMVFFKYTNDANVRDHVGVVTSASDVNGTMTFVDATSSGVAQKNMNYLYPSVGTSPNLGRLNNALLVNPSVRGKYAGELWDGFGTVRNINSQGQ